jgi:hypothetical protein
MSLPTDTSSESSEQKDLSGLPLVYFLESPLRAFLELEFEMTMMDLARDPGIQLSKSSEEVLHDAVIPRVFFDAIKEFGSALLSGNAYVPLSTQLQSLVRQKLTLCLQEVLAF